MHGAMVSRAILGQFHFRDCRLGVPAERRLQRSDRVGRRCQQLPRRPGVAQFMAALTEEPQAAVGDMEPGAHAIAVRRRTLDRDLGDRRQAADSCQRVPYDSALDRELSRVGDVREHIAAAAPIADIADAVRRRLDHASSTRPRRAALRLLDVCFDDFAGDGAAHQQDCAVVAGDHPSAGGGLLDRDRHAVSNVHGNVSAGSPKYSRI
jgi:hypothetical protein